jgi:hypothetical protein
MLTNKINLYAVNYRDVEYLFYVKPENLHQSECRFYFFPLTNNEKTHKLTKGKVIEMCYDKMNEKIFTYQDDLNRNKELKQSFKDALQFIISTHSLPA